jgi:hypothetical protein
MSYPLRIAASVLVTAVVASSAIAQNPSSVARRPTPPSQNPARRSIVYRRPTLYDMQRTAAYQNPGGVGRYSEFYSGGIPPQTGQDPVRVATFGGGGIPDRQEQLQAQAIGIQRYNSIQQHIDRFAAPYFGWGFGAGVFGGFN